MPLDLQILLIGAAAAVDTALLSSLLERRNLRNVMIPIVTLLLGTWLFHCGELVRVLLFEATSIWAEPLTWMAMSTMAAGLLLMPCSLLHGTFRLWRTGVNFQVTPSKWFAAAYSPLLLLPWAMYLLADRPSQPFLVRLAVFVVPFTAFLVAVNLFAIVAFLRQCQRSDSHELRRFMTSMALLLFAVTGLVAYAFWIAEPARRVAGSPLLLVVILAPLGPTLLFTYFVIRYRFMQLLLERSFVYGSMIAAAMLFHRLFVQPATEQLGVRFRVDFGIVEGISVFLLVLLYQPARRRVTEALRYLLGGNARDLRARTRQLAVEMWRHLHDEPQSLVDWFVASLSESLEIQIAAAWLFESDGSVLLRAGRVDHFSAEQAQALHGQLESHAFISVDGQGDPDPQAGDLLRRMDASLAVRLDHSGFSGLLLLGRRSRAREYGEEETNAILLLVELLGATLHSHYLETQRLRAERLAAQNEKLGALGMLTSCLAHEIKNPLSSIKTIAAIMAEQFGEGHPHAVDVRLILSEVERLSTTVNQFLRYARPTDPGSGESPSGMDHVGSTPIGPVIQGAIQLLSGLANNKEVRIETSCEPNLPAIAADDSALREIVFNLLLNAIEAMDRGGRINVEVRCDGRCVVTTVRDNGPGIVAEVRDRLFAPFATSKPAGTGLGLFIVRRNVEQLRGQVAYECQPGAGTCFTVTLPCS